MPTTTTSKKTGRKTTITKKTTPVSEEVKETVDAPVKEVKKERKVTSIDANAMIPCKSVTAGELLLPGKKSGILYRWANYGDVTEVEYQDLLALKSTKSRYIYEPWFIIDDEEVLGVSMWNDLNKVYESFYDIEDNIESIFDISNDEFESRIESMPKGMQKTIASIARTKIDDGSFDSLAKVKAMDRVFGTDLLTLIKD